MFNFLNLNSKDIGIDLGTANLLVTLKGKGIVLKEPSVVAIDKRSGEIMATGYEAKEMLGRTPETIKAVRPLRDGVIADFTATELMLKNIIKKVCRQNNVGKPRVLVGVPSGITEVEERAVEEAVMQAGAKEVYLIEEPMAAAIGANLDVSEPSGNIIVDIGGGTTEVAVVSLGGIVISHSLRIAGDELDEDIINYVKREYNLAIGDTTAEDIKKEIGCALPLMTEMTMEVTGRDLNTGLPRNIVITSSNVQEAIAVSINEIIETVKTTLEKTPPELASDIMEKGIVLAGGGALIKNLDKLLSEKTGMPVYVAEEPLDCVVKGTGKTLENIEKLRTVLIGIVVTVIILILLVVLSNINIEKLTVVENVFSTIVMPFQNGFTMLKNKISGNDTFFTDLDNLKTENEELKQKNSELEQSLRELEIIKAENATLKEQMNLKEKYGEYQTVSGYVINRDISNYTGMVVINVGSNDGVKPNMTVIADKGLVGNVVSVTENTAKVQTIVDPASSVSCIINTSKDAFITKGSINSGREIKATYIPTDAVLVQDTSVETSGLGGIYPKGIHVGTIKEVVNTQNPTDKYAIIETAVDFSKLDTVLVILN